MGANAAAGRATPPRVAVLGGGLAGLAAACELADAGYLVTLVERRPYLGGRAFSFLDPESSHMVDNGQHVFMKCCTAYIAFLGKLGTLQQTTLQNRLRVVVADRRGRRSAIASSPLPHPFHLLPSFLAYRHLSWRDKLLATYALLRIYLTDAEDWRSEDGRSFLEWLRAHGQSPGAIAHLWEMLIVATCNNGVERVSAGQALMVVKTGFLQDSHGADLGLARVGLSSLLEPAATYLSGRGGELLLERTVQALEWERERLAAVRLGDGSRLAADAFISALPFHQLLPLLPPELREGQFFAPAAGLETAPIVNLDLWYDQPVMDDDFLAFLDSPVQWVFNKGKLHGRDPGAYLDVSISGAQAYLELDKGELQTLVTRELAGQLPRTAQARLLRCLVIKERHATFAPSPGSAERRLPPKTPVPNLFLAGEWTTTGWPSTMESAVRSGLAAARALQQEFPLPRGHVASGRASVEPLLVKD